MTQLKTDQEWYTLDEVESITGYKVKTIDSAIRRGQIGNYKKELFRNRERILLHRDVVVQYVNLKEILEFKPQLGYLGNQEWFTLNQACIIIGKTHAYFSSLIRNGRIINVRIFINRKCVHREEVLSIIRRSDIVNNYYSSEDVARILRIRKGSINNLINAGNVKDFKKIDGDIYVSKIEIDNREIMLSYQNATDFLNYETGLSETEISSMLVKEWYTTSEIQSITGYPAQTISAAISKGSIEKYKKVKMGNDVRILLHRDEVIEYFMWRCIVGFQATPGYLGKQEWFTSKQAGIIIGEDKRYFEKLIGKGKINNSRQIRKANCIHRTDVIRIGDEINYIAKNYISAIEVSKKLNISIQLVTQWITLKKFSSVVRKGGKSYILSTDVEAIIMKKKTRVKFAEACKRYGLKKHVLNDLISRGKLEYEKESTGHVYISIKSLEAFYQELISGYTIKEVASKLHISEPEVRVLSSNYKVYKLWHSEKTGYRIRLKDFEKIRTFLENNLILSRIEAEYGFAKQYVKNQVISTGAVEYSSVKNNYIIERDEFERYLKTEKGISFKYFGVKEYHNYYNEFKTILIADTRFPITLDYFFKWSDIKLANTRSKRTMEIAKTYIKSAKALEYSLTKEIYLYDDDNVRELFKSDNTFMIPGTKTIIARHLNWLKETKECRFENNYSSYQKQDTPPERADVMYSKEEWVAIAGRLCDINSHLEKAICNRRYSETWLYMLLHLSLAWRKSDIMKMNYVPIELIDIVTHEWFNYNELSYEHAQILINEIQKKENGIIADKNRMQAHVVLGLILPTATAFLIAEIHRRESNKNDLLLSAKGKGYGGRDFRKVIGEILPNFKNRKANSSLLTYGFETAATKGSRAAIAYQLSSYARSHKPKIGSHSETTKEYLHLLGTNVNAADMAFHLFERGIFGWQINLMLDLLISSELWELSEKTKVIKEFQQSISPMSMESVSKHLYIRHQQYQELVVELLGLSRDDIMKKLEDVSKYRSPAKVEFSQCLKGINNCQFTSKDCCLGCKYHIPTNYILNIVNWKLKVALGRLEDCKYDELNRRVKLTYLVDKLLYIIGDFKKAYRSIDENYFKSFINIEDLERMLMKNEHKMTILKELNDYVIDKD